MERALIVAAHPDDDILGCGGSIAKLCAKRHAVRVVFLAEGVSARYDIDQVQSPEVVAAIEHRNRCAVAALGRLGVSSENVFLSERLCCRLDQQPLIDLVKSIEDHIKDFEPTICYTHAAFDVNVDHRTAHWAALAAARPVRNSALRAIVGFEIPSSTEWNTAAPFAPTIFEDISDHIDNKIAALREFDQEMHSPPHPRSEEVIRALAVVRGAQAGMRHAEGFSLIRATGV